MRKSETVHKLPVITVLGFDITCLPHNPNILLLKDFLSFSQLAFESYQNFSSSLLLINSPTQFSDFNLLHSLHWRHGKQHEITLLSGVLMFTPVFQQGKCFLASQIKKITFWKQRCYINQRENGYCLECDYRDHKVELTLTTL